MNETIGSKGGHNDNLRTMRIIDEKKRKKQEEDEELKELEKEVRKKQFYTLIKTVPIMVGMGTLKVLADTATKEDEREIRETRQEIPPKRPIKVSPNIPKKQKVTVYIDGKKEEIIYIPLVDKEEVKQQVSKPIPQSLEQPIQQKEKQTIENKQVIETSLPEKQIEVLEEEPLEEYEEVIEPEIKPIIPEIPVEETLSMANDFLEKINESKSIELLDLSKKEFDNLPEPAKETLDKLKNRKILDYYAEQLKELKYELKDLISDYNVLVKEEKEVKQSEEAEEILDRLNEIIDRVEELKDKIQIENLELYDDNYIFYLIGEYLDYFKEGKLVDEIKDSPLYNLIDKKLDEIDKKKDDFKKEVETKKDELEDKEENFEELKNKYYSVDKINQELIDFQIKQQRLLEDIRRKVDESTSVKERVETEIVGMTKQSKRVLQLLTLQMLLPFPKSVKQTSATIAAYIYFMNNVVKPNTITKRYKIITVKDYNDSIMDSISKIEDSKYLLSKTSYQVDSIIKEINEKYSDYIDSIPECKEMLSNLKRMKSDLQAQEEEMNRIQRQQELEYERNNAKVKTMGEYPVN